MASKKQSSRLTAQQREREGAKGIFGKEALRHDSTTGEVSRLVAGTLEHRYPKLKFRHRPNIQKKEINEALQRLDPYLGQTLFVEKASIKPDGGIIEVLDDHEHWRVVLVTEAKYQGKDVQNIERGELVGRNRDQDIMAAGNAIERSFKNIAEMANLMLAESHFPYVLFLEGSNFLTQTIHISRPDGRVVTLTYNSGTLNRLDRLTAANYGMPLNSNLCKNRFIQHDDKTIMLQAASIYVQGNGQRWDRQGMLDIMLEVAETSLQMLGRDLWNQMNKQV